MSLSKTGTAASVLQYNHYEASASENLANARKVLSHGIAYLNPQDGPVEYYDIKCKQIEVKHFVQEINALNNAHRHIEAMIRALDNTIQSVQTISESLSTINPQPATDLGVTADLIQDALRNVINAGNDRFGDYYLFSGTKSNVPPFKPFIKKDEWEGVAIDRIVEVSYKGSSQPLSFRTGANNLSIGVLGAASYSTSNYGAFIDLNHGDLSSLSNRGIDIFRSLITLHELTWKKATITQPKLTRAQLDFHRALEHLDMVKTKLATDQSNITARIEYAEACKNQLQEIINKKRTLDDLKLTDQMRQSDAQIQIVRKIRHNQFAMPTLPT